MRDVPDQPAERVLVVIAHPDDAEFWAGGTVARWTDAGSQVTYCVLSDGEAGGFDPAIPRSEIRQARRAEQAEGLPLTPTGTAGAMVVRAPVITAALREYFELLWERATPRVCADNFSAVVGVPD